MDEFEGRMTADAHTIMVESAVASGMNTLRVRLGSLPSIRELLALDD